MTDPLRMLRRRISRISASATSSPGSADGHWLYSLPDGINREKYGLAPAHANPSPSPESSEGSETTVTYGPSSRLSSASARLQSCLENRLRPRLRGSPECEVIWKKWITPWGAVLSKPRARVRRSSGIVFGLWPSAQARDGFPAHKPEYVAEKRALGHGMSNLNDYVVNFALWPQSAARDWKNSKASQETLERNSRPCNEVVFSCWSALRASDGEKGGPRMSFGAGGSPLPSQVFQTERSLSVVPMESSGGCLHPEFAGWEMGYSPEWLSCADSGTQSIPRSRRSGSGRS